MAEDVARAREQLTRWNVKAGMRVGIFAPNSYHYIAYDLALVDLRAISVPFTDDFAGSINQELVDRYNISLFLLGRGVAHGFTSQDTYVASSKVTTEMSVRGHMPPIRNGDEVDDLCLAFSSGSAGGLKGLVISRRGAELMLPPVMEVVGTNHQDRLLLFLPMSNFQQRMMYYAAIWYDFDIIVTEYTQLYPAMNAAQPTILIAPSILYHLLHNALFRARIEELAPGACRTPFDALPLGPAGFAASLPNIAFKDVHAIFGGKMRLLISGMAPLNRNQCNSLIACMLPLCESYGLAEAGSLTYRPAFSNKYGSVGKPLSGVTISFEDGWRDHRPSRKISHAQIFPMRSWRK